LPKPSYTIDTLAYLKEKFPQHNFALIMGSDNLQSFHKWKNYEMILNNHEVFVYKRRGFEGHQLARSENVHILDVPLLEISASFIRENIGKKFLCNIFYPKKYGTTLPKAVCINSLCLNFCLRLLRSAKLSP
jgi:nicotinate-nucleotide adenylyltransferase